MAFDKIVDSQWLENLFKSIGNAIRGKTGGTEDIPIEQMSAEITDIQTGIDTSDATAVAGDIREGATAYANGEKVTGTFVELDTSDATATADDILARKTAYINGEKVTGTIPTANYTTKITVDNEGLITSTLTHTGGYRPSGTHETKKQLGTVSAKTIIPTSTEKVAVSKGQYAIGDVMVEGDKNLIASNIKNGVSIFGVEGIYVGEGAEAYEGVVYVSSKGDIAEMNGRVYYTNPLGNFTHTELSSDVVSTKIMVLKNTIIACVDKVDAYTGVEVIDVNYGNENVHVPTENGFTLSIRE